ncbi:MAG: hypothetical protein GY757_42205 [bacterium]|nr:hypothetical protein [bacterium]
MSEEINKKKLLCEIESLMEVPNFFESIKCKILEFKAIMAKFPSRYKALLSKKKVVNRESVKFRLHRAGGDLWLSDIAPGEIYGYDTAVGKMIDSIVGSVSGPGVIHQKNDFTLPVLNGRVFDLYYEKMNPDLIEGTIKEKGIVVDDSNVVDMNPYAEDIHQRKLMELMQYLVKHEGYYEFVRNEFNKVWKPMLDKKAAKERKKDAGS